MCFHMFFPFVDDTYNMCGRYYGFSSIAAYQDSGRPVFFGWI
ncbi:hypothetical protein ALP07_200001 [Pseudomonas savastanoi pv. glycinea]|nr:hypothetical protein ALP07_200001 [Pseudomonas savastanoi pv. glycinea]